MKNISSSQIVFLNSFALFGSATMVAIAFTMQIVLAELPCALCNLQRLAFLLLGAGFLINLLHPKMYKKGYLVAGVAAVVGACTSIAQVFIHILPTDEGGVGSPVLGFHLYAWCFLIFILSIIFVQILQTVHSDPLDLGYDKNPRWQYSHHSVAVKAVIIFYVVVSIIATLSAFTANGFGPFLEGGQQKYWLIEVVKNPGADITKSMLMQP